MWARARSICARLSRSRARTVSSWSRSKLVAPTSAWSWPAPSPASRMRPASSCSDSPTMAMSRSRCCLSSLTTSLSSPLVHGSSPSSTTSVEGVALRTFFAGAAFLAGVGAAFVTGAAFLVGVDVVDADVVAAVLVAGAFLAAVLVAGAFFATVFFAALVVAGTFFAGAFFAGAFLAGAFFAGAFFAGAFFADAFFADAFFAGAFVAVLFAAAASPAVEPSGDAARVRPITRFAAAAAVPARDLRVVPAISEGLQHPSGVGEPHGGREASRCTLTSQPRLAEMRERPPRGAVVLVEQEVRKSVLVVTQHGAQTLRRVAAVDGSLRLAAAGKCLQLLREVGLQAGAVLALELAEGLDVAVQLVALLLQVAEHLLAALGGLGVEHLRTLAGVCLHAVGLGLGLGLDTLGLGARGTDDAVGLVLGVLDELVGVARRDLEETGGGVGRLRHGRDAHRLHRRGGDGGRLGPLGLRLRLGLGLRLRSGGGERRRRGGGRRRTTGLRGRQLGPQVLVLLGEPGELGLDLVEELVHLAHVVALTEADRRKALVAHVLRRQRHDLTQTFTIEYHGGSAVRRQ